MSSIDIRRCAFADIEHAPNLTKLMDEYGAESAMIALGPQRPQFPTYRLMEEIGTSHSFGAFQGEDLVGFIIILVAVLPHFGLRVASTESFFVTCSARKGGTGLRLLRQAEEFAKELGAVGFFVSAPIGSRLESVMPKAGYSEASKIFFRSFACSPQ